MLGVVTKLGKLWCVGSSLIPPMGFVHEFEIFVTKIGSRSGSQFGLLGVATTLATRGISPGGLR